MIESRPPRRENVAISKLRPTQLTIGMLEVKHKHKRLRALEKRPSELVGFILEMPIRVVLWPNKCAYVIDHHHLALGLLKEHFETAPMEIEADVSHLPSGLGKPTWFDNKILDFGLLDSILPIVGMQLTPWVALRELWLFLF